MTTTISATVFQKFLENNLINKSFEQIFVNCYKQ